MSSFVLLPEEVPKGFLEGYTPVAALLVLFQAFHGLAVALVYKYADAIVKNFANSSVRAHPDRRLSRPRPRPPTLP